MHRIDTQIIPLNWVANETAKQLVNVDVRFNVKKIVFKPLNIITLAADHDSTQVLLFSDLYSLNRPIGYAAHLLQQNAGGAHIGVQWTQTATDITFTYDEPKCIQGNYSFLLGDPLNGGNITAASPLTGTILLTIEFHESL
jgi:hypothetical protein